MKPLLTLLIALGLAACAPQPISSAQTTGTPTAGFDHVANVGPLRVRPLELIEDSRCPTNVQCVWTGRVTIRAEIEGGAGAEVAPLTLGSPLDLGGYTMTLTKVEPSKFEGKPISQDDYRFTFAFERLPFDR